MLQSLQPDTEFYRVTDQGRSWPDVLSGAGAYFSFGGRYNRAHQKSVYAAEDPLVAITEYAFHKTVRLQTLMGAGPLSDHPLLPPPPLPLVSEQFLWCFTLAQPLQVIDVEDPVAFHTFHHRAHELLNPSSDAYHRTAMLADLVRSHPDPAHPTAKGILAPSVRTPSSAGYVPRQHVFFVPHDLLAIPGKRVRRWRLTIEFGEMADDGDGPVHVTPETRAIDWTRVNVRHGEALAELFRREGVAARSVSGRMGRGERDKHLAAFHQGDLRVLCACDILNEGWDWWGRVRPVFAASTVLPHLGSHEGGEDGTHPAAADPVKGDLHAAARPGHAQGAGQGVPGRHRFRGQRFPVQPVA